MGFFLWVFFGGGCLLLFLCNGGILLVNCGPTELFLFKPVLHNLYNKSCGMCNPVCWMVHIKEPLQITEKSSSCSDDSRYPLYPSGLIPHEQCQITVNTKFGECIIK